MFNPNGIQPDKVVYYNGIPYIDSRPNKNLGMNVMGHPLSSISGFGGLSQQQFDALIGRGMLTPLGSSQQTQAPQIQAKPITVPPPPQAGWTPQGGGNTPGFDQIMNGSAPMFGGGLPQQSQGVAPPLTEATPTALPNPRAPQRNFTQFGNDLMSKILQGQGGA